MDNFDIECMQEALALAKLGWGHTNPNPMVGALVVSPDHKIIGRGYHVRPGEAHAEVNAIQDALRHHGSCKGCTIYVTLEPCCTTGRTPPCTDAIIKNGFARVVTGALDPNPKHAGKGIEILKKYNVNGVHDALIAISYTGSNIMNVKTSGLDIRDAEPYMVRAYFNNLTSSILTMMAYANYYFETRDYRSGREAHLYLAEMLQNMKIKKDAVAYVDKIIALSSYGCASFSQYLQ